MKSSAEQSLKLPVGWLVSALGDIATFEMGQAPAGAASNFNGVGTVFVKAGEFGLAEPIVREWTTEPKKYAKNGDVLICVVGATAGKLNFGIDCAIGRSVAAIRPEIGVKQKTIYFQLLPNVERMRANVSGSAQGVISQADLSRLVLRVPPAAEQTRIVEKLEELLSDLDAGVAELKVAQKKLAQYRQSLLKAAVEGALTADWRAARGLANEEAETGAQLLARILTERRSRWQVRQLAKFQAQGKAPPKDWQAKYPAPVAPGTNGLPELPQGWVWVTVDQLAHVGTGVTPLRSNVAYFDGGTIPWVTSGALNSETVTGANEQVTTLAAQQCRLELYPAGSLLLAMYGEGKTRGKCAELLIAATINQAIAAIVLEPSAQGCKAYLKTFLLKSYEKMREQAVGGVQPNLNLQIVKSICFPLPPMSEQTEINRTLDERFEQVSQQKMALEISLKQSSAQRKNILQAAFSGQLVPQDPADEPASALLARIRVERAGRGAGFARVRGRKTVAM